VRRVWKRVNVDGHDAEVLAALAAIKAMAIKAPAIKAPATKAP
jgi:hypothetical protein